MSDAFFFCYSMVPRVVVWFIYLDYISFLIAPSKATNKKICFNKNTKLLFFGSTGQIPSTVNFEHLEKWFYCLFSTWPDSSISTTIFILFFILCYFCSSDQLALGEVNPLFEKTIVLRSQRNGDGDEDLLMFIFFFTICRKKLSDGIWRPVRPHYIHFTTCSFLRRFFGCLRATRCSADFSLLKLG